MAQRLMEFPESSETVGLLFTEIEKTAVPVQVPLDPRTEKLKLVVGVTTMVFPVELLDQE